MNGIISISSAKTDGPAGWIRGTDERIVINACVRTVRDGKTGTVRFDRVLENPRGYQWDAPGARIRFRTDSGRIEVHLMYSARHIGPARNSIGFYRIDGLGTDEWRFSRPESSAAPGDAPLVLGLAALPASPGRTRVLHDYELILPYGDAVELQGIVLAPGARMEAPALAAKVRWVAFGDSVTQGFTASSVACTYAFLVGEAKGWETINAGFGGHGTRARDGEFLAGLDADVFSVAIGVNDWQGGAEPEAFRVQLNGLLDALRAGKPRAHVFVITPLWVPPGWKPATAKHPLEKYRSIIRQVVSGCADARVQVVEGPSLIDHEATRFDPVAVHPNDSGFAQMAERLAGIFNI